MKLSSGEWHKYLWWEVNTGSGNGSVPPGTTWTSVDPDLCHHNYGVTRPKWINKVFWCRDRYIFKNYINTMLEISLEKLLAKGNELSAQSLKYVTTAEKIISHFSSYLAWESGTIWNTGSTRTPAFWDTPRRHMITHTSDSHQIPSQNKTKSKLQILKNCQKCKFWKKLYTWHTFWGCLKRCINMKWIQPECRRYRADTKCGTDGRSENNIPPNNLVVQGV